MTTTAEPDRIGPAPSTCGCTSPGCRPTPTSRCRSSSAARAPTSGTPTASGTWTRCPACSWSRSGTAAAELADVMAEPGPQARLLPDLVLRPPEGDRAGRPAGRGGARRPEQGVLLLRRRRVGGDGLEGGQAVLQADRQAEQDQGHLPGRRLPRHHPGRPVDHQRARLQAPVRAPGPGHLPGAEHQLLPGARPSTPSDEKQFGLWAANRFEEAIIDEGPDSVAAVFVEPVQNAGGCFPPPPGYFERLREICDTYDVLLVSDEVICAYGRLGTMFGAEKYQLPARHHHQRQGPDLGLLPARRGDHLRPDLRAVRPGATTVFPHGYTFGGHPVSCAVGLANLDIFEREDLLGQRAAQRERVPADPGAALRPADRRATFAATATSTASSWSRTRAPRRPSTSAESERILRGYVSGALFENGLYCRADDRGDPVVQVAPPLICGQAEFDEMEQILRHVLSEAWRASEACRRRFVESFEGVVAFGSSTDRRQ